MSDKRTWDDKSRQELRETLQQFILGELRLAKRGRQSILNSCSEDLIADEAPEHERDGFDQFASDELERLEARLVAERETWPAETDNDRLDRVERALLDRGIVLWQASPCCDTCSGAELDDRIVVLDKRHPGFRARVRGYAYFIDQSLPEALAEGEQLSVFLAYGWFSPDNSEVAPAVYEKNALAIAREVCECLKAEGFEPDWDGDLSRKIGIDLKWQRRTMRSSGVWDSSADLVHS